MTERRYQHRLIEKIKKRFEGCMVLKNDCSYIQGIPDLIILYKKHWAALEVKKKTTSPKRPNQEHYISVMDEMSFARFISPEVEQEVLNEMERSFEI